MSNPLVSIIIPNFNNQSYVGQAIKSALHQTYENIEVIVVDDGSTDDSWSIIESFSLIKSIRQTNQGACVARNSGLRVANGEFIKFLDSDDFLVENCIAMQVRQALDFCDTDKIIPYGDSYTFFENSKRKPRKLGRLISTHSSDWFDLIFGNILTSRPLYCRESLRLIGGFDEQLMSKQEWCLNLKLYRHGYRFSYFPGETYWQRVHSSEYRISNRVRRLTTEMTDLQYILEQTKDTSGVSAEDFYSAWAWVFWTHGRAFLRAQNYRAAHCMFDYSKSLSPYGYQRYWPFLYKLGSSVFGVKYAEKVWARRTPMLLLVEKINSKLELLIKRG